MPKYESGCYSFCVYSFTIAFIIRKWSMHPVCCDIACVSSYVRLILRKDFCIVAKKLGLCFKACPEAQVAFWCSCSSSHLIPLGLYSFCACLSRLQCAARCFDVLYRWASRCIDFMVRLACLFLGVYSVAACQNSKCSSFMSMSLGFTASLVSLHVQSYFFSNKLFCSKYIYNKQSAQIQSFQRQMWYALYTLKTSAI